MGYRVSNTNVSIKKSKIAERLAFDPFTPQQELINEFIRNTINPDTDAGRSYYVGQVVKIIYNNDPEIENRDVFYSISDNSERASKDVSEKKYNSDRVTLIVHVPSFITSDRVSEFNLNYNNFTKLRVEHDLKKKEIKVGNIVKLQIYNKDTLYFPLIIDVEDVSPEYVLSDLQKNTAKEQFSKYLNCNIAAMDFSDKIGSVDYNSSTKPYGGYVQAIKEIENAFSAVFINGFLNTISSVQFGDKTKIKIDIRTLSLHPQVYEKLREYINVDKNIVLGTFSEEEILKYEKSGYLILAKDIVIQSDKEGTNVELKNKFYSYLKQQFESSLGYTLIFDDKTDITDFQLNINAYISYKGDPSIAGYIEKSLKTKDSSTYYSKISPTPSSPQVISKKNTPEPCENLIAAENSLYPIVYSSNGFNKDHDKIDQNIISLFYDDKVNQSDFLNLNYFAKLIGLENISKINDLVGKNSFYTNDSFSKDNYGEQNKASVKDIKLQMENIIKSLETLQKAIADNEITSEGSISLNNVLIVPRQILKIKKQGQIVSKGEDPNSRHYYGKAFDIAVYLKLSDKTKDKKIVQIRPEIVLLYVNKRLQSQKLGYGLFLEQQTRYYNHIEFLDGTKIINEKGNFVDINPNQRFFTANSVDIEKRIEGSANKLETLKDIIRNSKDFQNPITGKLDSRFARLVD